MQKLMLDFSNPVTIHPRKVISHNINLAVENIWWAAATVPILLPIVYTRFAFYYTHFAFYYTHFASHQESCCS